MSANDQIILDQVLEQERATRGGQVNEAEFFDRFVAEQELKDYDLSYDEVEAGIVGGGGDGGIDALYTFVNGELAQDDFDASSLRKSVEIEVVLIQSKTSASFNEDPIHRLKSVTSHVFDLSMPLEDYSTVYNEDVRSAAQIFREVYKKLATRFPILKFRYVYATRGDSRNVHNNVFRLANQDLREAVVRLYSQAGFEFYFRGASDLLAMARRRPLTSHDLPVAEIISATGGYIALVSIVDLYKFIVDDSNRLRRGIFEANVRDYQGATPVNEEIKETLSKQSGEDFWWLNNGVTIVANKAVQSGKTLTIEDPQIVNGLQTSREIFNFFNNRPTIQDTRRVMVKIIVADNSESRDKIIKATNSQTALPSASLRSTDKIHRDIEEYLQPYGFYYDRRKNFHKNNGKSAEQIVGIPALAQAIMSIVLQRPDHARARPSTLLKRDDEYLKIFDPTHPIQVYLIACKLLKLSQAILRNRTDIERNHKNNLLFYVVAHASACLAESKSPNSRDIASIDTDRISDAVVLESLESVNQIYTQNGKNDKLAKGPALVELLKSDLETRFPNNDDSLGELGGWRKRPG